MTGAGHLRATIAEASQAEIDALNLRIYETLNNGVYKSGFATTQHAYEEAVFPLFETLDWLEDKLANTRYLTGASITELIGVCYNTCQI